MSDTPETDNCVKEGKHIRFLEEDHWSLNGKFTYTHPIVALCRRLERQRDGLKSAADCASDLLYTAIAERDAAIAERDNALSDWRQADTDSIRALNERNEARKERDSLIEALEECKEDSIELLGERDWWKDEPRSDYGRRYKETRENITRADEILAIVKGLSNE